MRTKTTSELIQEMKTILNKRGGLTVESLVFSNESDNDSYYDDMEQKRPDKSMSSSTDIKSLITQIRKLVLNGIAQLAEHPESAEYEMLKKIWAVVDKASEQPSAQKKNFNDEDKYRQ